VGVHLEQREGVAGHVGGDGPARPHLGVVADAAQEAVGDARGAPAATGDLGGARLVDRDPEDARRARDDEVQVGVRVEVEPVDDAEPAAQGRGEETGPGGGGDQGEGLSGIFIDRAPGPLPIMRSRL
jgi:hypothetical protein